MTVAAICLRATWARLPFASDARRRPSVSFGCQSRQIEAAVADIELDSYLVEWYRRYASPSSLGADPATNVPDNKDDGCDQYEVEIPIAASRYRDSN